jgi:lysophospholipase L1-like esterase
MKTVCIFGDSITWGRGLSSRVAWANLLRNYLEDKDRSIHLYDLGIDGNATNDLLKRVREEAEHRSPELIIWAIGINDSAYIQTPENPVASEGKFTENITKLIEIGHNFSKKQAIIGIAKGSDANTTPLPESKTGKHYVSDRVHGYDEILETVANSHGIAFVRISNHLNDDDFYDGLHPNERGHMKIFLEIEPVISKLMLTKN